MLKILALMMGRNCASTLGRVLQHLNENDIPLVFIDHGSTDGSGEIARSFYGSEREGGVLQVDYEPYPGFFGLSRQLEIKRKIIDDSDAEWIFHVDADEIFETPSREESLRQFIERVDRSGYDVIDADEFVFPPRNEADNFEGSDFVETMRYYYRFAPRGRKLHRVFRKSYASDRWVHSGGHSVSVSEERIAPQKLRLRHYIGLSLNHLRRQYLGRVFSGMELKRGQHGNRVAPHQEFIKAPDNSRLHNLDRDGWRTEEPETKHLIFNAGSLFRPPDMLGLGSDRKPMPFIVGVGRSGTTLLRMMLDSHSQLTIPPETHWLGPLINELAKSPAVDKSRIATVLGKVPNWADMDISDSVLSDLVEGQFSDDRFDLIRGIYRTYAKRYGATLVGDKTPIHQLKMLDIAQSLPEAHFIHMIRDGRDVACSHKGLWFGPKHAVDAACMWTWRIGRARQQAQFLAHYLEVRYEDLVIYPERELRKICDFLCVEFEEPMLASHRNAKRRIAELGPIERDGVVLSSEKRQGIHALTSKPPDPSRIERWRTDLPHEELAQFEAIAGDMLEDLGYARSVQG